MNASHELSVDPPPMEPHHASPSAHAEEDEYHVNSIIRMFNVSGNKSPDYDAINAKCSAIMATLGTVPPPNLPSRIAEVHTPVADQTWYWPCVVFRWQKSVEPMTVHEAMICMQYLIWFKLIDVSAEYAHQCVVTHDNMARAIRAVMLEHYDQFEYGKDKKLPRFWEEDQTLEMVKLLHEWGVPVTRYALKCAHDDVYDGHCTMHRVVEWLKTHLPVELHNIDSDSD